MRIEHSTGHAGPAADRRGMAHVLQMPAIKEADQGSI